MEIKEVSFNVDTLLGERSQLASGQRSPGLHVSDIIKDIMQKLAPSRFGKPGEQESLPFAKFEVGFAWEELMGRMLGSRLVPGKSIVRPGEMEVDGIFMTPDWFELDPYRPVETKATWATARRNIDDPFFWHWMVQIKAYAYGFEAVEARMCVFFIMGDYKGNFPIVRIWDLKFTKLELTENWHMLLSHAKHKGWI